MSRDAVYLADMLDSARLICAYVEDHTLDELESETLLQDAVLRRFEVLGEAARRVSDETQQRFSSIPWQPIIAMRNLVIHQYDAVDFGIVWQTITSDLPPLIRALEQIAEDDSEMTAD
jgi:uncharacterized protein with HEPN domain